VTFETVGGLEFGPFNLMILTIRRFWVDAVPLVSIIDGCPDLVFIESK
jgi:hypothetical protein